MPSDSLFTRITRHVARVGNDSLYAGLLSLLPIAVVIGQFLIPSQWGSIWMDFEFSGWVAPIANRMASGQRLYADGGHMPMAPLPYVVVYWLTWGHARWITESAVNYACQMGAVATLFVGFRKILPWPAPLAAAFGLLVSFVSLPKVIVYDSFAQLFVAVGAVLAVHALSEAGGVRRSRAFMAMAGAASGIGFLAKQSTGTGLVIGVLLAIWVPKREGGVRERLDTTVRFALGSGASVLVLLAIFSPWIDLRGYAVDVLLTSTEAKGGQTMLVHFLDRFASQLLAGALGTPVPPLAFLVGFLAYMRSTKPPRAEEAGAWPILPAAIGAALGSTLAAIVTIRTGVEPDAALQSLLYVSCGFLGLLRWRDEPAPEWARALGVFALVTFPAALTHSLSGDQFRWTYDNNPLIWLPLALSATLLVLSFGSTRQKSAAVIASAVIAATVQFIASGQFAGQWARAAETTRIWPDVAFLRGARQRPHADGMWHVVTAVRRLAPAPTDTVLLFPNDPNVEAWFERPRPPVSSCMVFADQYWDRYVDSDFRVLQEQAPRLIVLGPRDYWARFSRLWQRDRAIDRLGKLVTEKLLPQRYTLAEAIPIAFRDGDDFMDLYVRKDVSSSNVTPQAPGHAER
jgi:hypothetical protein